MLNEINFIFESLYFKVLNEVAITLKDISEWRHMIYVTRFGQMKVDWVLKYGIWYKRILSKAVVVDKNSENNFWDEHMLVLCDNARWWHLSLAWTSGHSLIIRVAIWLW